MTLNLSNDHSCMNCKLEPTSVGESIEIERIDFRKAAKKKIADIMQNGVKRENQELDVELIICRRDDWDKLRGKRYNATLRTIAEIDNENVLVEFVLSDIEVSFDTRHLKVDDNRATISVANITVYAYGKEYGYRVIDD